MKSFCKACHSKEILVKTIFSNNWQICKICGHSSLINNSRFYIPVDYEKQNLATYKIKFRHKYLARILRNFSNKSILDIGAGNYLPLLMNGKKLQLKKYTGIDMHYQKKLNKFSYLNQINKNIYDSFDEIEDKYDLVILDNILEHLDRPDIVIRKILPTLKKSSKVYVSVPNKYNIKNIYDFEKEYHHYKEHIQVFTNSSINKIFLKNGFKSFNYFSQIYYFSIFPQITLSFLNLPLFGLYKIYRI